MKIGKIITISIFLVLTFNVVSGQGRISPKKMKVKENYTHLSTNFSFPDILFDDYKRESVYSFDRKNSNIGVTYERNNNGEKTTFTLYLYPAGEGHEYRLREEYSYSIQSVYSAMKQKGLKVKQWVVKHEGENYICKGIRAIFLNDNNDLSQLTLYESGIWFYKIRITSNHKDTVSILNLEQQIVEKYDPTILTELNPLVVYYKEYYDEIIFSDLILMGSAMGSAVRKVEWTMDSINDRERASGIPDFYLSFHVEAWKAFMEFQHRYDYQKSKFTENFLRELQLIYDANFLNEFIMEQYGWLMFPPENVRFRVEEFRKWKAKNNITINLNNRFATISFYIK
jgi:hypothetical protein